MSSYQIRPMNENDIPSFLAFTDKHIGRGYYNESSAKGILQKSQKDDLCSSLVLVDDEDSLDPIRGVRIAFPPKTWQHEAPQPCFTSKWKLPSGEVAYFKSLFLDPRCQGQGWGPKLSQASIQILKGMGAKAVVCHAWKESPDNSSMRYLTNFGFKVVGEHPKFWADIDYNCIKCKQPPCQCTAVEMIYYFE